MPQKNSKPNITIIVLDSLRLDEFKALKSESDLEGFAVTDKCIAPSPWTLPSHASLFTGMYPSEHGAHETKRIKVFDIDEIKLRRRTFVSDLNDIGYKTYAISANPYVHPVYGFSEFDYFREESYYTDLAGHAIEVPARLKPLLAKYRERYGGNPFKIALAIRDDPALMGEIELSDWSATAYLTLRNLLKKVRAKMIEGWPLEKGGKNTLRAVRKIIFRRPFFLFINLMEPHDPYMAGKGNDMKWYTSFLKEEPSKELVGKWKSLYGTASARGYSYALGIIASLRERYGANQLIILTSDHGQAFGEHDFICHGSELYDELVRVPFAVMLPRGFATSKGHGRASLVNVRPFIEAVLAGDRNAMDKLFSRRVYAESFGVPGDFIAVKGIDVKKLKRSDRRQRRAFQ